MKKIIFIIPHLGKGGAERFFSILLNNLDREKFDITLLLIYGLEGEYLQELNKDIRIETLNKSKLRYCFFELWKYLRNINPDIVVSTIGSLNIIISCLIPFLSKKIKFIARESNIISLLPCTKFEKFGYKYMFNNFFKIIAQSEDMKKDLIKHTNVSEKKIIVINNAIDNKIINKFLNKNEVKKSKKIRLINIGRLTAQKGQDMLIEIFSKIIKKNKEIELLILGSGPKEGELKKKVKELELEKEIHFLGFQNNPYSYMKSSDIYVATSRYEGFPNILLEANYCGLPIISFECKGGINEIIENGINGYTIKCFDLLEFSEKLNYMIEDKSIFDKEFLRNNIVNKYSIKKIVKEYEKLFENILI